MGDFKWSFLKRIVECIPNQRLVGECCFTEQLLRELDLTFVPGEVPEGLLIECCAQAAGLSLMLGEETISVLPVLARVNTCDFLSPLPTGSDAWVEAELLSRNEKSAAEFDCVIRLDSGQEPLLRCRLLLGLASLSDLPDGGAGILKHFEGLRLSFIDT